MKKKPVEKPTQLERNFLLREAHFLPYQAIVITLNNFFFFQG